MKETISHGVHGSQHFLCGTCPIALFAHFFSPRCFKCFSRVSLTCMLLWCSSLSAPTLTYTQLLPDHRIFIQTHLCTNSLSALHGVYALTVPRAPAVQWIRNLEQFFTGLKEEYLQTHSRLHQLCIVTILVCHRGGI